jgi:hypothetical protein
MAFEGPAVLGRGGPCAPAGPVGLLRVEIQRTAAGDRIVCRAGRRAAVLMQVNGRAAFAYSEDGRRWLPSWTDRPAAAPTPAPAVRRYSRRVLVRLADAEGRLEIIAGTERRRPPAAGGGAPAGAQL